MDDPEQIDCIHFRDGGLGVSECAAGRYGGRTTYGTCLRHCPWREPFPGSNAIPPQTTITFTARAEWPLAAKMLAALARPGDQGLGDIVARLAQLAGAQSLAEWYKYLTGRDCGCSARQSRLNTMFPLS